MQLSRCVQEAWVHDKVLICSIFCITKKISIKIDLYKIAFKCQPADVLKTSAHTRI